MIVIAISLAHFILSLLNTWFSLNPFFIRSFISAICVYVVLYLITTDTCTAVLIYNAVTNIFDKIVLLVKLTLLYSRILVILVIWS